MANSDKPTKATSDKAEPSKGRAAKTKPDPALKAAAATSTPDAKTATPAKETPSSPPKVKPAASKPAPAKAAEPAKVSEPKAKKAEPAASSSDSAVKAAPKEPVSMPVEAAKPTPKPDPTPAPPPVAQKSGSVFWPFVLGGVAAGVIGFVAAEMNAFGLRANDSTLSATVEAQAARIAELEAAVESAASAEMPDIAPLQDELSAVAGSIDTLTARLTDIENRPVVTATGDVDVSAYESQLSELQASVVAQKEELDRLLDNALSVEQATAEAARLAVVQGALTDVSAAITEGAPFAEALGVLGDNGVEDIPAALSDVAESGVATLSSLQSGFTDAARASLAAARASGVQEGEDGFGGFLRRSLGARSVAPREGSDPDAVLSRAEAAIRDSALDTALSEIETLPAPAQDALGTWLSDAKARAAARAAAQDLSERLTAN